MTVTKYYVLMTVTTDGKFLYATSEGRRAPTFDLKHAKSFTNPAAAAAFLPSCRSKTYPAPTVVPRDVDDGVVDA